LSHCFHLFTRIDNKSISQLRYIIDQGVILSLCELLNSNDAKIIQVAFNGLDNILKLGVEEAKQNNGTNTYATMIEECHGSLTNI
jgi:importin subunit alpha-6/7